MRFDLYIDCGNSAFDDTPGHELARILREAAERLGVGELDGYDKYVNLRDANGNIVGRMRLK